MTATLARRQATLALVAVVAAAASLAVTLAHRTRSGDLPRAVGSFAAVTGSGTVTPVGKRTTCGVVVLASTLGVAHPVLPCGARLYVRYGGKTVLATVIERGPYVPGRQLDLTAALAKRLGVVGIQTVHWGYAQAK